MKVWGAVELGGTKTNVAIGHAPDAIFDQIQFPTTTPQETLEHIVVFFRKYGALAGLGIASFGPLDVHRGAILRTPKHGWSGTEIAEVLAYSLGCPVIVDTDVNGAASAEGQWGAGRGLSDFVYITVGTGIGGGAVVAGQLHHGYLHSEMGHIHVKLHEADLGFKGVCPFHGDCLEGLASGPALAARLGFPAQNAPSDHKIWDIEANYLAQLCYNVTAILSPQKIILGGGVMECPGLLSKVQGCFQKMGADYLPLPRLQDYIVLPHLGAASGIIGAMGFVMEQQKGFDL